MTKKKESVTMHIDWTPDWFKDKECEWKGVFKLKKLKYPQQRDLFKKYSMTTTGDIDQEAAIGIIDKMIEFCYEVVVEVDIKAKKGDEAFTSFEEMVDDGRFAPLYQDVYKRILRGFFVSKK